MALPASLAPPSPESVKLFVPRRCAAQGPAMSTPSEEVKYFLAHNIADPEFSLSVAIQFARGMSNELRKTLAGWEAAEHLLEQRQSAFVAAAEA